MSAEPSIIFPSTQFNGDYRATCGGPIGPL
jgi:hypothetical protein